MVSILTVISHERYVKSSFKNGFFFRLIGRPADGVRQE